jgi:hypothetical protein
METRTRRAMALTALFATNVLMVLSGAPSANAWDKAPPPPIPASTETTGHMITVSVWGGVSTGSPGSVGGREVTVSAPCWMSASRTGKAYYEYVISGQMDRDNKAYGEHMTAETGWKTHKDDDKGHWYYGKCADDQTAKVANDYYVDHGWQFYPAGTEPPPPEVSPDLLRDIAFENLIPPPPELNWNPKLVGNQGTLVNLDTWLWLDNAPTILTVHARAGGNEASVTATFHGMDINAHGERTLRCPGTGTPYSRGATATCALAFSRASSALGAATTPVTVTTRWTGTWEANGDPMGALTTQPDPISATVNIRVDEVQTLVTGAL